MTPFVVHAQESLWERCSVEAYELRNSLALPAAANDSLRRIASSLEWILCEAFSEGADTREYWCDGVIVEPVPTSSDSIRLRGVAWCADYVGRQWRIPIEIQLRMEAADLRAIRFSMGDARVDSLRGHIGRNLRQPDEWLLEFEVIAPEPTPTVDPNRAIGVLQAWVMANPQRPIVGRDWEPLTLEKTIEEIHALAARGEEPKIEETWLERGPALRLA